MNVNLKKCIRKENRSHYSQNTGTQYAIRISGHKEYHKTECEMNGNEMANLIYENQSNISYREYEI